MGSGFNGVVFSPDGAFLASASRDGTVRVWDARQLKAEELGIIRGRIPPRPPNIQPTLIDLSPHYNVSLEESWYRAKGPTVIGPSLQGVQKLAGVPFDVRGLVQVGALSRLGEPYPKKVSGMAVGLACQRLHFLHAAINATRTTDGTQIGSYIVRYADGHCQDLPIVVGRNVADWWTQAYERNKAFVVAWEGQNESDGRAVRLFISTWQNPLPANEVKSIEFVSSHSEAAPFLLAITAE